MWLARQHRKPNPRHADERQSVGSNALGGRVFAVVDAQSRESMP